jgi:hypothetical protein
MKMHRLCTALLLVALLAGLGADACACSVPVFRYALERWPADPYEIIVFHRGPLKDNEKAAVTQLDAASQDKTAPANLEVVMVDLDANPDPALAKLWDAQTETELPAMMVRYPRALRRNETVWITKLTVASVEVLLHSPLRTKVARQLLKGETAVWLLLEGGDKKKDDAAAALLEKQLKTMPDVLELPELDKNDPADRIARGPNAPELKISFVVFRLSRDDPAEQALIQMLLHSEEDLRSFEKEPMAFPVFGRGRVDLGLVGGGIEARNIKESCARLIGPCTCQVKRLNPGTDLLIAADWEAFLKSAPRSEETPAPSKGAPTTEKSVTKPEATPTPTPTSEEAGAEFQLQMPLLILLGCVGVTLAAALAFGKWRRLGP